ncbi:uncharacterized protein LOC133905867 [Phragmites australis]|uniref:uncharacterized protein LOC133905867 n=1 Tax=Phragmites australis TaxID=29695 RepID=UPI002D793584|nr:uncharacterized protein LOC133905867 [Phragmites australis]
MGGWNRPRLTRKHRDRRPSRPPLPPPDYGQNHCSVPLWEREFCSYVGDISWQRFCENKQYVSVYNNLEHWDDSGAFENYQNAKARFWANYHGQASDIPLPDPDMYIDKVNHWCKVDPEVVADLDKVRLPFDSDNNLAPAAGLANTGADNKCTQNRSGNWDIYIEKPAEVDKWDWEDHSRPNLSWGVKHESFDKWGNSNSGWGDALDNPNWHSSSNNHYSSNNRNSFHGGSNNRYQDQSNMSGRKRNNGGYLQHKNSRQRNQAEGYQRSGWQDRGGRDKEWRPLHNRACQNGQGIEGGL